MTGPIPPLRGDGKGNYRIYIVGHCGNTHTPLIFPLPKLNNSFVANPMKRVRKGLALYYNIRLWSTLGKTLGQMLSLPNISLDELHWKPNWVESSALELQARIREWVSKSGDSWVVDGNYQRKGGKIVLEEATDVIWLDPPFVIAFYRLLKRTISRILGIAPFCAEGCHETFSHAFLSANPDESVLVYSILNHSRVKRMFEDMQRQYGDASAGDGGKVRRLGGWSFGADVERWLGQVKQCV